MEDNPFLYEKFMKDIKRSFIPTKIFNQNKYKYNITNVEFRLKKDNIVYIILKLENGKKFEHVYVLKNKTNKNKINNDEMNIDEIVKNLENMDIDKN